MVQLARTSRQQDGGVVKAAGASLEARIRDCYQRLKAAPDDRATAAELVALINEFHRQYDERERLELRVNAAGGEC